jgi:hypothetical protein
MNDFGDDLRRITRRAGGRRRRTGRLGPAIMVAALLTMSVGAGSAAAIGYHFAPGKVQAHSFVAPRAPAAAPATHAASGAFAFGSGSAKPDSASAVQYGNPFQQFLADLLNAIGSIFSGGGGAGLVSGIAAAIAALLAALGL